MARPHVRTLAFLAAMGAALPVVAQVPAHASALPVFSSCQDVRRTNPIARDGTYLLINNGNVFTVYCHNMATRPSEYITLVRRGRDANFSQYTAGGASPGTDVRTTFTRLRVDPRTLTVDIGDLTFASSTGSLRHSSTTVTSMPYGAAMACTGRADGRGNIDLRDTPFQVDDTFVTAGNGAHGSASVSARNQVVGLRGGGYCGWITPAPAMYNPFNPRPGTPHLELRCAGDGMVFSRGQFCLRLDDGAPVTTQVRRQGGQGRVIVQHGGKAVAVLAPDGQVRSLR
ncbi:GON domain-containing protein [Nonomuraea sp. KM88]|uniref:GON domain-containing protein n=1 Tax=Nonomuraea sp. KM88 TaxID=3457427 RepID=UPI003FCCC5DE